jgi:hypothetical protein
MDPYDAAAARDADGDGGERGVLARLYPQAEQVTEEALVRGRQQHCLAHPRESVGRPQEFERLRCRLAEVEAHVEEHPLGRDPRHNRHLEAVDEEVLDGGDDVAVGVAGVGVVDAGAQADVGRDDRGAGCRRDGEVTRVAEPADVVAEHRPGRVSGFGDLGAPGVDRERDVEPPRDRLDCGDDTVELLGDAYGLAGAGLHAADVDDVGTVGDEPLGAANSGVELEGGAVVVERVRRAVDDAHDERARGDVVAAGAERDEGGCRRPHDAGAVGLRAHGAQKSCEASARR